MTTPVLIRGGKAHPITEAQWALARAHKPIGPVAGLDDTRRPPTAAAPVAPPAPQPPKADGRALSRASMLKQIGAQYGADARAIAEARPDRSLGVDPKAATIGDRAPVASPGAMSREDARAYGRRNMLAQVERTQGKAARARAEARLGIRAA